MRNGLHTIRGILLLQDEAFAEFKASPHALERGLLIVLVVALLVGLVNSAVGLVSGLRQVPLEAERQQVKQEAIGGFERGIAYANLDPELVEMIKTYMETGIDIGFDIAALPTPFVGPVGTILQMMGAALSTPFSYVSGWLLYTLLVLLAAKILGGTATLQKMLGCTALHFIPYTLNVVQSVPWLGRLAGAIAFVWGALIFIKATAAANNMTTVRGFLATILPCVIALALLLIAIPTGLIIVMVSAG